MIPVYLVDVILLSRLGYTFADRPIGRRRALGMILVQWTGLAALRPDWWLLAAGVVLTVLVGGEYFLEHCRENHLNRWRLLLLGVQVLAAAVTTSAWMAPSWNPLLHRFAAGIAPYLAGTELAARISWPSLALILLGCLLVCNEANLLIRWIFQRLDLVPTNPGEPGLIQLDRREYNAGRIIGILERIIVYLLVLHQQYAAIGLIVAAKAFARFKELDQRRFAEYVLIGTLLSVLLAVLVGWLIAGLRV